MKLTEKQIAAAKEFFASINAVLIKNGLTTAFDLQEELDANEEKKYKFKFSISSPSINVTTDKTQDKK